MKNLFIGLGIGGALGSAVTFFVMNKKLEKRVNKIVSGTNTNRNEDNGEVRSNELESGGKSDESKDEKKEYNEKIKEYNTLSKNEHNIPDTLNEDTKEKELIHFISEEDFETDDKYSLETLYYYDDNVLADESDIAISNPYSYIGDCDLRNTFNETGEDVLYIRNNDKYVDYRIYRSEQYFSDLEG